MTRWTVELTDLGSPTRLADHVPFTGFGYSLGLGGAGGSFSGAMPVDFKGWVPAFSDDGNRKVLWPCRDGVPQGAYLYQGLTWNPAESQATVRAVHLEWLFSRRTIYDTLTYLDVDQFEIARDLLRYSLNRGSSASVEKWGANPGDVGYAQVPWFRFGTEMSGRTRTRQETPGNTDDGYPGTSHKVVAACVKQLTELEDGFDYRWDYGRDPDTGLPFLLFRPGYPAVGLWEGADNEPVFEFPGGNIIQANYATDASPMVSRAIVLGQDREGGRPVGSYTSPTLINAGFPLLSSVHSESSVQDRDVLNEIAYRYLQGATDGWSITLDGNRKPLFGSYNVGDCVVMRVRPPALKLPDRNQRITGWTVTVDEHLASETVSPTIVSLG